MTGWAQTSGACSTCDIGFYMNGTDCYMCPNNCKICTSSTNCTLCLDEHQFYGQACCTYGTDACDIDGFSINCTFGFSIQGQGCYC